MAMHFLRKLSTKAALRIRNFASASGEVQEGYAQSLSALHWIMAGCTLTCFTSVQLSMNVAKDDPEKDAKTGRYMLLHKSSALIVAACLIPRMSLRFLTKLPPHIQGPVVLQHASTISHYVLYGFMTFMPVSGILMGYFGGRGVPFFNLFTLPAIAKPSKEDKGRAYTAYKLHKKTGRMFEYFTMVHFSGAGYHSFKGQTIFARINPFRA